MGPSAADRDPVVFAQDVLRTNTWNTLEAFLRATLTHSRIAIRGCHASSKTFGAAQLCLWWLSKYPDGVVVTVAPGARQVDELLWLEIRKAKRGSRIKFPEVTGSAKSGGIRLDLALDNYALGFSTEKGGEGVKAQGIHAAHLLIIVDEAPGVSAEVMDALEGMAAGGHCVIVMLGNPTIPGGPFYEAFTKKRSVWKTFTIDAYDTPNFVELRKLAIAMWPTLPSAEQEVWREPKEYVTSLLEDLPKDHPAITFAPRPLLVNPSWAKERLIAWGPSSPRWESRVRGQFPSQAEDALISLRWLEAAKLREPVDDGGPLTAGVDVAGAGKDETAVVVRCGPSIIAQWSSQASEEQAWRECEQFLMQFRPRLRDVNVDYAGGYGASLALQLEDKGFNVNRVNVGEAPRDSEQFYLLKAELYWGLRERFKAGDVNGLEDETTIAQLAALRYEINARNQVVMETKEKMAKRGVKALAINTPIPTPTGWATMGDLRPGDWVFDESGRPTRIRAVSEIREDQRCFAVRFSDDHEIVAEAGHLWETHQRYSGHTTYYFTRGRLRGERLQRIAIRTTEQISKTLTNPHKGQKWNHRVRLGASLQLPPAELPIPPYVLGVWLGDGDADRARVTKAAADMEFIAHEIERCGVAVSWGARVNNPGVKLESVNGRLRQLDLLYNKHIPAVYLRGSIEQRIALLQGLLDTDGTVDPNRGRIQISSSYPALAHGILELIRSLGIKPSVCTYQPPIGREAQRIQFIAYRDTPLFRLPRKLERQTDKPGNAAISAARSIVACDPVDSEPVRCVTVEAPSGLFLAGIGMIPTHNSPDRAEAMMLAFANQTPGILEYYQMRAETPDKEPGSAGELPDDGLQRVYEDTVRELEGAHTEKVKMAKGKSDIGISSDSGWTPPGFKR